MNYEHTEQGRLPACSIDEGLLRDLWQLISGNGDTNKQLSWQAAIGTGGDILGSQEERPVQTITNWDEMVDMLAKLPRIDQLTVTIEVDGTGIMAIAFRNHPPAGGSFVITSNQEDWVKEKAKAVEALFRATRVPFANRLYTKLGFGMVQTAIPLTISFIVVMVVAALFIPVELRQSEYIWWITAGTVVATLRLAYTISDKLMIYFLRRYPYLRWGNS